MNHTDPTAVLARIRQMADYWEQNLPEVIRTPAVVSALRAAMEGASAVVSPPTDRAACDCEAEVHMGAGFYHQPQCATRRAAVLPEPTDRAAALSEAERAMLTYALDQAQERIWVDDGFTHEDQAALDSLRRLAVEAHDTGTQQAERCPHGCDVTHCPCLACDAEDTEAQQQEPVLPSIHASDVQGFCPACGHPTLYVGEGGHLTCALMDCPKPEAADEMLHAGAGAQQQPDIGARAEEPPTEEQMVRDHVTTLHLIGEQLARVEAWMWAHLADVRDAQAATAAPVAQQAAVEAEQDDTVHACPGRWGGPNCRCFDAEPAPGEQQTAAADDEETPSRAVLLDLVRDFLDADPCSFDHHGYCQAHGWLGGEPGSCPHGRARKLIPGIDEDTAP